MPCRLPLGSVLTPMRWCCRVEGQDRLGDLLVLVAIGDISSGSSLLLFNASNLTTPCTRIHLSVNGALHVKLYRHPDGKVYAIVSMGMTRNATDYDRVVAVDVTDPRTPVQVAAVHTNCRCAEGVSIVGDMAFVGGFCNNNVALVDLSHLPQRLTLRKTATGPAYRLMVSAVFVPSTGKRKPLLLSAASSDPGGLFVFDYEKMAAGQIADVGRLVSAQTAFANRVHVRPDLQLAFLPLENSRPPPNHSKPVPPGGIAVVDMQSPSRPELRWVGKIPNATSRTYCLATKGEYLYAFGSPAQMFVYRMRTTPTPAPAPTRAACTCGNDCKSLVNPRRREKEAFLVAAAVKPRLWPTCPQAGRDACMPPIDWRNWDGLATTTTIVYAWGHPLRWFGNGTAYILPSEYGANHPFPDYGLLCQAHARGIRVIISIGDGGDRGNLTAMLPHPSRHAVLASNLARLVKQYGFDGLEVDFESAYKSSNTTVWAEYVAFLKTLSSTMHAVVPGSYVTMTHYCNPSPFMAANSHAVVAATDAVLVMCYGFNHRARFAPYMACPDCPLTGGWWGQGMDQIPALVAQGVPADRLIVSVSWEGKRYPCNEPASSSPTNCSFAKPAAGREAFDLIHLYEIEGMLSNRSTGCMPGWDNASATALMDCPAGVYPTSGVPASVRSQTWYQSARAIVARYRYASQVGAWAVGAYVAGSIGNRSEPAIWQALSRFLSG